MPGAEIMDEILKYCNKKKVTSGIVIGIIGSLVKARLNYLKELPGKYISIDYEGPLEIVNAQGSIARKDNELICHIHMQIANEHFCYGGHLVSGDIFSTAEVTIGELDYQLARYTDRYTGLNELRINEAGN